MCQFVRWHKGGVFHNFHNPVENRIPGGVDCGFLGKFARILLA
jgi:hypothetical protein